VWDRGLRSLADDVRDLVLKWHVSFLHTPLLGRVQLHRSAVYFGQSHLVLGAAVSFCHITFLYNEDRKRGLVYRALGQVVEGIYLHASGRVLLAERG